MQIKFNSLCFHVYWIMTFPFVHFICYNLQSRRKQEAPKHEPFKFHLNKFLAFLREKKFFSLFPDAKGNLF